MSEIFAQLPPYSLVFLAGFISLITRGQIRSAIVLTLLGASAFSMWSVGRAEPVTFTTDFMGYTLTPYRTDSLSLLFGYLFHIAAFMAALFALHVKSRAEHFHALIYAGAGLGAVFAGDFLTLFVFLEIMAVSSAFLVWASGSENAVRAGIRYLIIQVVSGVLLLTGALLLVHDGRGLTLQALELDTLASWIIFASLAIKCAFPLLHNWVTDAYSKATPSGAVFLCIFTTKTAIYLLARSFAGTELLIYIGAVMAVFPVFYAMIENDLRKVLAYGLINQLGFMVIGIGIGTELALNATYAIAVSHVLYKSVLFMGLGAVLHSTGRTQASALGALGKSMPVLAGLFIFAAMATSFPLFSSYISKSLLTSAVSKEHIAWLYGVLLFGSAGLFVTVAVKVTHGVFFGGDKDLKPSKVPFNMMLAMALGLIISVLAGVFPQVLYGLLPHDVSYDPYTASKVLSQLQLLAFAGLAFLILRSVKFAPKYEPSELIDAEWLYRKAAPCLVCAFLWIGRPINNFVRGVFMKLYAKTFARLSLHHGPEGILARAWPIGSTVLWVAVFLGLYLIIYLD